MNRATPRMQAFAKRLIAHEARESASPGEKIPVTFFVAELRPQLANLMGTAGFRALLARALALASTEAPWLRAVHVRPDGSLEELCELEAQVGAKAFLEGRILLLAHLLGLLVAFIGENLMLQLVRDVWPKLARNDLDLDEDNANE